jgi:cytochrome c oxidase cbb3-type subunit 1
MSDSCSSGAPASIAAVEASCRLPVVVLFGGAALWLLAGAVAAVLATLSFHKPDIFADNAWLSYGRILPVAKHALLYGFSLSAAFGLALWFTARLGQAPLACGFAALVGATVWQLGALVGGLGILLGAGTGYEGFDLPGYASVLLFAASVLLGGVCLLTLHARREREMYPTQWFVLGGVLWWPWILSTALCLLVWWPVRGVTQAVIHYWYVNNLQLVVLGLFGIGALLYFFPKLSGKNLPSRHLALFTFLSLVLFGSWVGVPEGGPVPAWIGVVSGLAALFAFVPALSLMENLRHVCCFRAPAPEAKFFSLAGMFFVVASLLTALSVLPGLAGRLEFTLFHTARTQLLVAGFFGFTAIGGIYHVLPRVTGLNWPLAGLVRLHFWIALAGLLLIVLPYLAGGWRQGGQLANPAIPFLDIARGTLMPIRMATLGETLWAVGALLFVGNVFALLGAWVRSLVKPAVAEWTAPVAVTEGKA